MQVWGMHGTAVKSMNHRLKLLNTAALYGFNNSTRMLCTWIQAASVAAAVVLKRQLDTPAAELS
jgi:hypothetical protein